MRLLGLDANLDLRDVALGVHTLPPERLSVRHVDHDMDAQECHTDHDVTGRDPHVAGDAVPARHRRNNQRAAADYMRHQIQGMRFAPTSLRRDRWATCRATLRGDDDHRDDDDDRDRPPDPSPHTADRRLREDTGWTTVGVPSPQQFTWEGCIFGTPTRHALDFVFVDALSAERALEGHVRDLPSLRSDHRAIGQTVLLATDEWDMAKRLARTSPKPIRWAVPESNADTFAMATTTLLDAWHPRVGPWRA